MRPLILLSNDDGINATGIVTLAESLERIGEVLVVAPDRERSASSHMITLHEPLRPHKHAEQWFSVTGTPVDCIYVALLRLAPRAPAVVVSGINHGHNLGSDVFYSGTVGAAAEGALRGLPAVAVSQAPGGDFDYSASFATAVVQQVIERGLPERTVLNINVPREPGDGYRWTRLGKRVYRDLVDERVDPRGRKYYWIGGPSLDVKDVPESDGAAVQEGLVSITPLRLDLTAYDILEPAPAWDLEGYEPQ